MEHITSIMIHPLSKICLCPGSMEDGGEILSFLCSREYFSVPWGRAFLTAAGFGKRKFQSESKPADFYGSWEKARVIPILPGAGYQMPAPAAREQGSALRKPLPLLLASDDG